MRKKKKFNPKPSLHNLVVIWEVKEEILSWKKKKFGKIVGEERREWREGREEREGGEFFQLRERKG
jgi:hypothetical protein